MTGVHVVHVLPYLETGGTEKHVLTLVNALRELGLATGEVLAPAGPFADQLRQAGIPWTPFTAANRNIFRSYATFRRELRRLLPHASLIHVHAAPDLLLFAAAAGARKPRVLTVHGFHGKGAGTSYRFAARWGNRFADAIISVSGSEEQLLLAGGARREKLHRIYNGVADPAEAAERYSRSERREAGLRLAFIGRLSPVKGVDVLLKALAALAQEPAGAGVSLDIMGVGAQEAELRALAEELSIADRVRFCGFRPDAAAQLGNYDLLCLPSREDMCPLVCAEAMAQGLPVVATTVGGIPEMVAHGETGLLVPADDVTTLTSALAALAADPDLRRRMGSAGRRRYEALFTEEQMARRTAAVYQQVLPS